MLTKQQQHQAERKDLLDCPPGAYRITWQHESQQGRVSSEALLVSQMLARS